jgi:alpha-L-fucosidase 2
MDFHKLTEFLDTLEEKYKVPASDVRVMKDHREIYRHFTGHSDAAGEHPVTEKDYYELYSMTKVMTLVCVLQQIEQGRIDLDAPLAAYLPEYADMKVADEGTWSSSPDESTPTHPAKQQILIRDVLTMTAGFSYDFASPWVKKAVKESGGKATTREIIAACAKMPLIHEPGEIWNYGISMDVMAAVVEVVSGERFSEYLDTHVLRPLGIGGGLTFWPDENVKKHISQLYERGADKKIRVGADDAIVRLTSEFESGGGGLYGTAEAYSTVLDALANGGVGANGAQILRPETIAMLTKCQLTEKQLQGFRSFDKVGYGYSFGVRTLVDPEKASSPEGEFGWDGAAGSWCLVDTKNHISIVYCMTIVGYYEMYVQVHPMIRDLVYEGIGDTDRIVNHNASMRWEDSTPMGNGFLGAMVYGHTDIEKIQLNDDSLWYGGRNDRVNPKAIEALPKVRELIQNRKFDDAEDLMYSSMIASPYNMRNYSNLGELDYSVNQKGGFPNGWFPETDGTEYRSCLDLMHGVLTVTDRDEKGTPFTRQMFISNPDRALFLRVSTDDATPFRMDVKMDRCPYSDDIRPDDRRPGKYASAGIWQAARCDEMHTVDGKYLIMTGNEAGTKFAAGLTVITDGILEDRYSRFSVHDASYVVVCLTSSTINRSEDPVKAVQEELVRLGKSSFDEAKKAHMKDFASLMERCRLTVEEDPKCSLYWSFARYLLVSGSREGSSALNLQGIWNREFTPNWDSKYTININTEMNYWPCDVTNLGELNEPLFAMLRRMQKSGEKNARVMYGCRGMMCHHNTDFYGDCATQDNYPAATFWPMGAAWLSLHIMEHYRYTKDKEFLRKYYDILDESALFFIDFLTRDKEGYLVTSPSVSPENRFITEEGYDTPICAGPTMDNQIIRALMRDVLEAADILGVKNEHKEEYEKIMKEVRPNEIGRDGRLKEWAAEEKEYTPGMPHVSHLFGVFPGDEITKQKDPAIYEAAKKSLACRFANGAENYGGWPGAWYIALCARFRDGEKTDHFIHHVLEDFGANMLNSKGTFQIDANCGLLAGMAECLIQSHEGIDFLSALPQSWKNGHVEGLRARGGVTADLTWMNGALHKAVLTADADGDVRVLGRVPQGVTPLSVDNDGFVVRLKAGVPLEMVY